MSGRSLFDKIWEQHVVLPENPNTPAILYIDLHLVHEVTSPQAFDLLRSNGISVRRPDLTLATMDHSTPTVPVSTLKDLKVVAEPEAYNQIVQMENNCEEFGLELRGLGNSERGIVHVIAPELGATQPGKTIVCGDSHTSTHGALGALAFGIGTTEVYHVLATQCLLQRKPKTFAINLEGHLQSGVTAKDIILGIIGKIGIEYRGDAVKQLSIEERMTICNMAIEGGARTGMFAPDDSTYEYLHGRPHAPQDEAWDIALKDWKMLPSDDDAQFDKEVTLDVSKLRPMATFGTNPGMVIPIDGAIPSPSSSDQGFTKALDYMQLEAGQPLAGSPVDVVFIGSCTNGRIEDLRNAANLLKGKKVAENVSAIVVPGSGLVKAQAEEEGIDKIFKEAGFEWREPGCSMCLAMNADKLKPKERCASTSNRNFEGRQGRGGRTHLVSPGMAVAAAVNGHLADVRKIQ